MKQIVHHTHLFETQTGMVRRLLSDWQPRSFDLSEKQQERDLSLWLKTYLPDVPLVAQYGIAKGKADIVIQDSFVIELKLGFDEASVCEFDRCVGQMERYRQKWTVSERGPVFLVVVGESDAEFRSLLHNWFEEANSRTVLNWFHLIEKQ